MTPEYINFVDVTPEGRKTAIHEVRSALHGDLLGHIKWFGRWRQFAFFPESDTIWNPACLSSVNEHIAEMTRLWRQAHP